MLLRKMINAYIKCAIEYGKFHINSKIFFSEKKGVVGNILMKGEMSADRRTQADRPGL